MEIKRREHLTARVTRSVKREAQRAAERQGISLSALVFQVVRDHVEDEESKQNDEVNE